MTNEIIEQRRADEEDGGEHADISAVMREAAPSAQPSPPMEEREKKTDDAAFYRHAGPTDLRSKRQSRSVFDLEGVEPWAEAVDGNVLLGELVGVLKRFVVLPKWAAETLAL